MTENRYSTAPLLPEQNLRSIYNSHAISAGWYALSNVLPKPKTRSDLSRAETVVRLAPGGGGVGHRPGDLARPDAAGRGRVTGPVN
jgi:DNA-binding transcriptional LysR family regulator